MQIFKFSAIVWKVLEKNVIEFFFKAVCNIVLATLWVVVRQSKLRNYLLEEQFRYTQVLLMEWLKFK